MKKNLLIAICSFLCSVNFLFAQFISMESFFAPTGISDQGLVAGYSAQVGPYQVWNPDSGFISDIGGIAPGQGVGGQARFSADGNFLSGTSEGINFPELSRYDFTTGLWTSLGSLGFMIDSTLSGGFGISSDGNTVVGLSWADTTGGFAAAHAVAYNATEGMMDLGSLFSSIGRSTRANAVSGDGSVVVGWQDFNGPWKSAVWRKNPAGGYYPNEYLLIDTTGSANDEYNQLGECSCISFDGNWIGGYGDYANNNEPWIWSQDSGVINLGTLPNTGTGYVSGMSADASVAVGWFDGQLFGDPQTPFIWTRASGLLELNDYINNILSDSTGTRRVWGASCISENGQYITGYGVDDSTFNNFIFRVSLFSTGIQTVQEKSLINVYPNPASNFITVENPGQAVLKLCSINGKLLKRMTIAQKATIDISDVDAGVYLLSVQTEGAIQTRMIVKE